MTDSHPGFAGLAEAVSAAPLDEVGDVAARHAGGPQQALALAFEEVPARFRPERAGGGRGVFRLEVGTGQAVETYQVTVDGGCCEVSREAAAAPDVTMRMDFADFMRLMTGRTTGQEAFLTGKVQVSGDLVYAMRWGDWFGRS
jgi:putative sterol carrier protein